MNDLIRRADLFNKLVTAQDKADCFSVIQGMPTIDAEPVRHGHWEYIKPEKDGVYGQCSVCGYEAATTFYCPNCGAKMDNGG